MGRLPSLNKSSGSLARLGSRVSVQDAEVPMIDGRDLRVGLDRGWREPREWLAAFKASRVKGRVVKGATTRYQPRRRDWVKVNSAGCFMFGWPAVRVLCLGQRAVWRLPVVRDKC